MRRQAARISLRILLIVIAVCFPAADRSFCAKYPSANGRVNDYAGVLSSGDVSRLNGMINELDRKTGAEIGILVVKSLDGASVEEYANGVFNEWGIGKKGEDNGALLLVTVKDRAMRIEVGYGLEPLIPDGLAGEIRDEQMIPNFKAGRYGQGLLEATARIAEIIGGSRGVSLEKTDVPKRSTTGNPQILFFFAISSLFVFIGFSLIGSGVNGLASRALTGCFPLVFGTVFGGFALLAFVGSTAAHGLLWLSIPQFAIAIAATIIGYRNPEMMQSHGRGSGGWRSGGGGFSGGFGGSSGGGGFGGGSSGGGGASGHW